MYRAPASLLVLVAATAIALAAPAAAEANYLATAPDPAGDAADPSPGRDITAIGLSYDRRSGELDGAIRLAGEPAEGASALVTLFAGTRTASGCNGVPAAGFGSFSDEFGASWLQIDDAAGNGPRGEADKAGYRSTIQEFEVTDLRLAGQRFNCVIATLSEPGNPSNIYDAAGPIDLVGQPALSLRISGTRRAFRADRPRKVKLTLSNPGDAPTGRVRLKLSRARGLTTKLGARSLRPIAPGRRRTVTATLTLSPRARTATDLKFTAIAGDLTARQETTLLLRKPSRPGGGGGSDSPGVCTRYQADLSGETGGSLILVPC